MNEIDELISSAKEKEEAQQERLRDIDKDLADRLAAEKERRERLSKAIGEKFPTGKDAKGKVTLEMEAYLAEKDEQKRLIQRQDLADRLGLTMEELDNYLLRGENK